MTINFNLKEIKMILNIYNFKINRQMNVDYAKLSSMLGVYQQDRCFTKVKEYLKEIGVINEYDKFGNSILIELNNKKLESEIPEIPFLRFYEENFRGKQKTEKFLYD